MAKRMPLQSGLFNEGILLLASESPLTLIEDNDGRLDCGKYFLLWQFEYPWVYSNQPIETGKNFGQSRNYYPPNLGGARDG